MRSKVGLCFAFGLLGAECAAAAQIDPGKADVAKATVVAATKPLSRNVAAQVVNRQAALTEHSPKKASAKAPVVIANIDLVRQRMRVSVHGKMVGNWPISSGKLGHETPPGRFRPQWAAKMHYSRKYNNSPMPYSVFFNRGIATHGTAYTNRLGAPASHGCIRLRTANARKFYRLVHRHGYKRTRIVVSGRAPTKRAALRRSHRNVVKHARRKAPTTRRSSRKRYSLNHYEDRRAAQHQKRLRRYYQARRLVFPGDRR